MSEDLQDLECDMHAAAGRLSVTGVALDRAIELAVSIDALVSDETIVAIGPRVWEEVALVARDRTRFDRDYNRAENRFLRAAKEAERHALGEAA